MTIQSTLLKLLTIAFTFVCYTSYADRGAAVTISSTPGAVPNDLDGSLRKGVTSGYYLGFSSLADELRQLRRPSDIPVTDGFVKTFYFDLHFANQEQCNSNPVETESHFIWEVNYSDCGTVKGTW